MEYQNYSLANGMTEVLLEEPKIYAGFWERFGAAFIDGLILLIPDFAIMYLLGPGGGNLVTILLGWLYFSLQESGPQQATIGKKALGLKVEGPDGQRISFGQATGRHFGKLLSTVILFIGYLMMIWDAKKQTLHDKIAGTVVVKS